MKKNVLIAIVMLGAMCKASAMISPEDRSVFPRQGFRYSKRSIVVNRFGNLVIPRRFLKNSRPSLFDKYDNVLLNDDGLKPVFLDEDENLHLDAWFEWKNLSSDVCGVRSYGENYEDPEAARKEYESMVDDFQESLESESKINKLRESSKNEFESWQNASSLDNFLKEMRIPKKIFGMRKEKISAHKQIYKAFSAPLNNAFDHQEDELYVSLDNVKRELENLSDNEVDRKKLLNDQKKLVETEIESFKNKKNIDSFYRSSMTDKNFRLFEQYRSGQSQYQPHYGTRE